MLTDFSIEYSQRSDDELLHLASERHSLTIEAAAALDAELRRRNLTESDRVEHQKFVKRQARREGKRRRLKIAGLREMTWRDILGALAAIAVISFTYLALPSRYHMGPDWQDAAFLVMMTSVFIFIATGNVFRRNFVFWISLVMSSAIHLVVVHAWTQRVRNLSRGEGKLAVILGFVLFFAVYGFVRLLQRVFLREEGQRTRSGDGLRLLLQRYSGSPMQPSAEGAAENSLVRRAASAGSQHHTNKSRRGDL